ncbi:MAG: efflux RND transporter permease subunit [Bacteroidota bacterium]
MWYRLGLHLLKYRLLILVFLLASTAFMAWQASKVQLSYEFSKAIPTDHPAYLEYQRFRSQFGEEGNLLLLGIQTDSMFRLTFFKAFQQWQNSFKKIKGVDDVWSIATALQLTKDSAQEKLRSSYLFPDTLHSQIDLDQAALKLKSIPFYDHLIYNAQSGVYLVGIRVDKQLINSKERNRIVQEIVDVAEAFERLHYTEVYMSGLPLVRTVMSTRIANEMKLFLLLSVVFSAIILLFFFRSFSAMMLSMLVVAMGVIWSIATIVLFGYKITLLNALIPPLIVVIGIPNCIYFLNKFHLEYKKTGDQRQALLQMVSKMGVVTLFCNIAAAIGFAVFALTKSSILKEFGMVAGINIMVLFIISFMIIPTILSFLKPPKRRHIRYLENAFLNRWLMRIEKWVFHHPKTIYMVSGVVILVSAIGIFRLKSVGYIVDDLPQNDILYTDLNFFEKHFGGVMPLEIVVDTKKKMGVTRNLMNLKKIDSLVQYLNHQPEMGKSIAITEGLKLARQAYYDGDSSMYALPGDFDLPFLSGYLQQGKDTKSNLSKMIAGFTDSMRSKARISVTMADIGTEKLPALLNNIRSYADTLFNRDSILLAHTKSPQLKEDNFDQEEIKRKADIVLTGTSVTFLEGSRFIINGLKESIFWAFLLIAATMLYLFRGWRILVCSLIPNVLPLVITAGVMGWVGVPLKPSTVLVFSVALGISIDVTIRFLINYKQELPHFHNKAIPTIKQTIQHTGISIIYTSLVLVAGFIVFCFSGFGGTQALGWLTSLTLLVSMIANLILLPVLLSHINIKKG